MVFLEILVSILTYTNYTICCRIFARKMNILVIAPQPFFTTRGTPLAVRELVSTFIRLGHNVDILTFHLGEDIALPGLDIYRNSLLRGVIKFIPPGFSWNKFILDIILLFKALGLIIKNNHDVVHCIEESACFIVWFRWIGRFKFIYDMDSDIPRQLRESSRIKNSFILWVIRLIERYTIRHSDGVVTICPVLTQKVKEICPKKTVFQIEDVSVIDEFSPAISHPGRRIVLYTGNFEEYQGVEILIEGFKRIQKDYPDVDLLLVGGEEEDINDLKKRSGDSRITFIGKKPFSEIPNLLQQATILVSPRLKGINTPFKIYSYLASGRPILATNIISHTQILTDGLDALLVDPKPEGIADGLSRLLSNFQLMVRLGKNARALFESRYTHRCYEDKVRKYLDFLNKPMSTYAVDKMSTA